MNGSSFRSDDSQNRTKKILERLRVFDDQEKRASLPNSEQQRSIFFNEKPWLIKNQERVLFKQQEEKAKRQVDLILEELQKIAQSNKKLTKEVKKTIEQTPVQPGIYHINLLEKIRQNLVLFRKKIDQSATWLMISRSRNKRKGHYWNQVQQSGTKYLHSQERYMATQVG